MTMTKSLLHIYSLKQYTPICICLYKSMHRTINASIVVSYSMHLVDSAFHWRKFWFQLYFFDAVLFVKFFSVFSLFLSIPFWLCVCVLQTRAQTRLNWLVFMHWLLSEVRPEHCFPVIVFCSWPSSSLCNPLLIVCKKHINCVATLVGHSASRCTHIAYLSFVGLFSPTTKK